METDPNKSDRVSLILHEIEALPTLSAVAVRLLQLTEDDNAKASEVIDLVASDPSLASKVLALCRCHERGRASEVATIDRAVLLLGFDAVSCAVLSAQVFDVIDGMESPAGETLTEKPLFDREAFWLHALGVAVASEQIAGRGTLTRDIRPGEAFIAGLLHDIGQLALHVLLPESFDRVCRITETHSASLDRACRQIIGLDTHTAGKWLAEHWDLPQSLVDVIWLSEQPFEALPQTPHRTLIALVSLADAVVRSRYITPGAHWSRNENLSMLCIPLGIALDEVDTIADGLHEAVSSRAEALGMCLTHDPTILLRSISRANASLARANAGMRQRERLAQTQTRRIKAISTFHRSIASRVTLVDVLGQISLSASAAFDCLVAVALHEGTDGDTWRMVRFEADGRAFGSRLVELPSDAIPIDTLIRDLHGTAPVAAVMPWLAEYLGRGFDVTNVRMLPLSGGRGAKSILLLESTNESMEEREHIEDLVQCWTGALSAAAQHDSAVHLSEQLAETNRNLHELRDTLAHSQTMATLGEVAAGAAHEMNNPLTIISGRSQVLATRLPDPELHRMATDIAEQAHRLSDMITALRSFAEPIDPNIQAVDVADLVVRVVQRYGPRDRPQPQVNTVFSDVLPLLHLDAELIGKALGELVRNACESKGSRHIELRVQTDPLDNRLKIEVRDDGSGMDAHTLRHAFDPFFSAKPAGRQPGLGLAHARRYVEAHGGRITLINGPTGGAIATIWLKEWDEENHERRSAA